MAARTFISASRNCLELSTSSTELFAAAVKKETYVRRPLPSALELAGAAAAAAAAERLLAATGRPLCFKGADTHEPMQTDAVWGA